ncbi:MAG: hypothetical protein QG608_3770 [Actinomycetota bacterium]|nr:hypothetical protein [Actinomycetota bacterium]
MIRPALRPCDPLRPANTVSITTFDTVPDLSGTVLSNTALSDTALSDTVLSNTVLSNTVVRSGGIRTMSGQSEEMLT